MKSSCPYIIISYTCTCAASPHAIVTSKADSVKRLHIFLIAQSESIPLEERMKQEDKTETKHLFTSSYKVVLASQCTVTILVYENTSWLIHLPPKTFHTSSS